MLEYLKYILSKFQVNNKNIFPNNTHISKDGKNYLKDDIITTIKLIAARLLMKVHLFNSESIGTIIHSCCSFPRSKSRVYTGAAFRLRHCLSSIHRKHKSFTCAKIRDFTIGEKLRKKVSPTSTRYI